MAALCREWRHGVGVVSFLYHEPTSHYSSSRSGLQFALFTVKRKIIYVKYCYFYEFLEVKVGKMQVDYLALNIILGLLFNAYDLQI